MNAKEEYQQRLAAYQNQRTLVAQREEERQRLAEKQAADKEVAVIEQSKKELEREIKGYRAAQEVLSEEWQEVEKKYNGIIEKIGAYQAMPDTLPTTEETRIKRFQEYNSAADIPAAEAERFDRLIEEYNVSLARDSKNTKSRLVSIERYRFLGQQLDLLTADEKLLQDPKRAEVFNKTIEEYNNDRSEDTKLTFNNAEEYKALLAKGKENKASAAREGFDKVAKYMKEPLPTDLDDYLKLADAAEAEETPGEHSMKLWVVEARFDSLLEGFNPQIKENIRAFKQKSKDTVDISEDYKVKRKGRPAFGGA